MKALFAHGAQSLMSAPKFGRRKEFYKNENPAEDKSYILVDEMRLFAMDLKSRVTFISRVRS
jgi:hypothetical protein